MTAAVSDLTDAERAAIGDSVEQAWSEIMAGARAFNPGADTCWIRPGNQPSSSTASSLRTTIASSKGSVAGWDHSSS